MFLELSISRLAGQLARLDGRIRQHRSLDRRSDDIRGQLLAIADVAVLDQHRRHVGQ